MKIISVYLIISLAIFACLDKDCFSTLADSYKSIDYTANDVESTNAIASHVDLLEEDELCAKDILTSNLVCINRERPLNSDSFVPQKISFCIWQPPKIS